MNIDIKPSKTAYLTPIIFLLVGVTIFFMLIIGLIRDSGTSSNYLSPGDSITIEVREDELYYIMVDTISRDHFSFYEGPFHSAFSISSGTTTYEVAIVIYEEGDTSNIVIAEELSENTSMTFNDYEAIMTIRFEEAGTYVIDTYAEEPDFPEFSISVTNMNISMILSSVMGALLAGFIGIIGAIVSFTIIKNKRTKFIREHPSSRYQRQTKKENFDDFDEYGNYK